MNTDFSNFKCRCSGIHKIMASSRDNPCLTDKQTDELKEFREKLDAGKTLTDKQQARMAELIVRENNGSKIVLSDGAIEYLMEVYAWQTVRKRPLKEQFEIQQM